MANDAFLLLSVNSQPDDVIPGLVYLSEVFSGSSLPVGFPTASFPFSIRNLPYYLERDSYGWETFCIEKPFLLPFADFI